MTMKPIAFLLAGGLLIAAAWFVKPSNPAQTGRNANEKLDETVQKGLQYLAKTQQKDGRWEGDDGKHPVALTSLAALALLMDKSPPKSLALPAGGNGRPVSSESKFQAGVVMAANWLMEKKQARDGLIYSGHASDTSCYMHGHGLATIFLAGVRQGPVDEKLAAQLDLALDRAVKYILKSQSSQGGWYDTSRQEGHDFDNVLATALQCQALRAAHEIRIRVPEALNDARAFFGKALETNGEPLGREPRAKLTLEELAAALACLDDLSQYTAGTRALWNNELMRRLPVGDEIKFGRDEFVHYYAAHYRYARRSDAWNSYLAAILDRVNGNQREDGSWPGGHGAGIGAGPVYSTAMWCIILQLGKNSHPAARLEPVVTF